MLLIDKKKINEWGKKVRSRDNEICQRCGSNIHVSAHHIIPKANDQSKALDVDNGITLCRNCHSVAVKGSVHDVFKIGYTVKEFWVWFNER